MDTSTEKQWWDLEQLVQQANARLPQEQALSVRNVRRLCSEGALSAPVRQGRNAYYTSAHLEQLLHVRALMAQGFTLSALQKLTQTNTPWGISGASVLSHTQPYDSKEDTQSIFKDGYSDPRSVPVHQMRSSGGYGSTSSALSSSQVYANVDGYLNAKTQAIYESQSAVALSPKSLKALGSVKHSAWIAESGVQEDQVNQEVQGSEQGQSTPTSEQKALMGLSFLKTLQEDQSRGAVNASPVSRTVGNTIQLGGNLSTTLHPEWGAPASSGKQDDSNKSASCSMAPEVLGVEQWVHTHWKQEQLEHPTLPLHINIEHQQLGQMLKDTKISAEQWQKHCEQLSAQVYQVLISLGKEQEQK